MVPREGGPSFISVGWTPGKKGRRRQRSDYFTDLLSELGKKKRNKGSASEREREREPLHRDRLKGMCAVPRISDNLCENWVQADDERQAGNGELYKNMQSF